MMNSSKQNRNAAHLQQTVIDGGYCVGCGACASVPNSPFRMSLNEYGCFEASLSDPDLGQQPFPPLCPFGDDSFTEDELGNRLFGKEAILDNKLGFSLAFYAGYVNEGSFREQGSSGGMGSWIACELFDKGYIDALLHVHAIRSEASGGSLFRFVVSKNVDQVRHGAKSRYYPIEMSEVLQYVQSNPGRYGVVGLPCFVKAIRQLMLSVPVIQERIKFCISLVCGHLKSSRFAESMAWQLGITPSALTMIDFRHKLSGRPASDYGLSAIGNIDGKVEQRISPVRPLFGSNWGHGFFKYKSCDYCDDVVGETADISVGDAWLPQYQNDSSGTNIVIVRNVEIRNLIDQARAEGRLLLEAVTRQEIVQSQDAGFRHRREGLAFRLAQARTRGDWHPPKRVQPSYGHLDRKSRQRMALRELMSDESHKAFAAARRANDFNVFRNRMQPLIDSYVKTYSTSRWRRTAAYIKKIIHRLLVRFHDRSES